jgi:hypothetical protein
MVTLGKQIQLVDTCKHCTESKREWTTLKRLSLGLGSYAPVWEKLYCWPFPKVEDTVWW